MVGTGSLVKHAVRTSQLQELLPRRTGSEARGAAWVGAGRRRRLEGLVGRGRAADRRAGARPARPAAAQGPRGVR